MPVKTARFVVSNTTFKKCPAPILPEYAFIGRSNVGKSSLINMLTNNKSLAKTSVKPGKTQLINHFIINDSWYLVDLPGYGYAKTSKKNRDLWSGFISDYLVKRANLICIFVLIDSRLKPQKIDLEFMYQLAINRLPFAIVFTKSDKISVNQLNINVNEFFKSMKKDWESLPQHFISSSQTKKGKPEILAYIEQLNQSEFAEEIRKTKIDYEKTE